MKGATTPFKAGAEAFSVRCADRSVGAGIGNKVFCCTGTSVSIRVESSTSSYSYALKKKVRSRRWQSFEMNTGPLKVKPGSCSCSGRRDKPSELFFQVFEF